MKCHRVSNCVQAWASSDGLNLVHYPLSRGRLPGIILIVDGYCVCGRGHAVCADRETPSVASAFKCFMRGTNEERSVSSVCIQISELPFKTEWIFFCLHAILVAFGMGF